MFLICPQNEYSLNWNSEVLLGDKGYYPLCYEFANTCSLDSQLCLLDLLVRSPDCHEERAPDEWVLLGLSLAALPALLVGAGEEVVEDAALRQHRMSTHAVDEALQLIHAVLEELLLVAA